MITSLPTGFQFMPTRKELLFDYLMNKVLGKELPWNGVKETNLYGDQSPWELFNKNDIDTWHISETNKNTQVLYCFTKLKRLKNGTKNFVRTGGCGHWHGESCKSFNEGGCEKMFKFKPTLPLHEEGEGANVSWLMHEYSLSSEILKEINRESNDYVICKITRREEKSNSMNNNQDFRDSKVEIVVEGSIGKRKYAAKDNDAIITSCQYQHQHQQESKVARIEDKSLRLDEQYILETDHGSTVELFTTLMNGIEEQSTCQNIQEKSTFSINGLKKEIVLTSEQIIEMVSDSDTKLYFDRDSSQEHVSYQPISASETIKEEDKLQLDDERYILETDHGSTMELFTTLMNGVEESTFPINGLQKEIVVGDEKIDEDTEWPLLVGKTIPMSEAGLWMEIDEIQAIDMFNKL